MSACVGWPAVAAATGTERAAERLVAGEIAEHPEDVGGLGAVVDGGDGSGKGLAGARAGAGWFDKGQMPSDQFSSISRARIAAMVLLDPKRFHECGQTFVEPGRVAVGWRQDVSVGEGVDQGAVELIGGPGMKAGCEQGAGFKGRVVGVGQVEKVELGARLMSQPALQERRYAGGFVEPGLHGDVVVRNV